MSTSIPFFDGHNDTLLRLFRPGEQRRGDLFFTGSDEGHLDLPRARQANMKGGFYAVYAPSPMPPDAALRAGPGETAELPPTPDHADALAATLRLAAGLFELEQRAEGTFRVVRSQRDLIDALNNDVHAAIFHIEGLEAIDEELDALFVLHQAGLRSVGPVWSRRNVFAEGVPFAFPSSPDTGPGLTDAGFELVRACNDLGILIDLSHINQKGFFDVARTSKAPLVATHSNAHAVCASSRNLTDDQLRTVAESGGVVGLNFAAGFLHPEGAWGEEVTPEIMLRHTDHILGIVGEGGLVLGSDFDGARIPEFLGDVRGTQKLLSAMLKHGYGQELVERIAMHNWVDVLGRTWK